MFCGKFKVTLIVGLSCLTALSSSFLTKPERGFSVDATRQGKRPTGPAGLHAALIKYNRFVPLEVEQAAQDPSILLDGYKNNCTSDELAELQKQVGSTRAEAFGDDKGFSGAFLVGKSKLNLFIDTGSSDLWVYSNFLPKNETKGYRLYNTSSGVRLKGYSWKIKYGDGTAAAGVVYRDSVQVGAATATSQAVEAATSISGRGASDGTDGIVGLAFKPLNTIKPVKQAPLWETLNPILREKVFAVDFHHLSGGTLDFGYVNASRYQGPVSYAAVEAPYWGLKLTEYQINGKSVPACGGGNATTGIVDTGTPGVYITTSVADQFYKTVKGSKKIHGSWLFPCSTKLGNLGLKIGGRFFYVYGEYFKQPLREGVCFGAVQGYFDCHQGAIVGAPFIVGNYIVFDGKRQRIGFARKSLHLNSSSS